jgi:hypothetical protein
MGFNSAFKGLTTEKNFQTFRVDFDRSTGGAAKCFTHLSDQSLTHLTGRLKVSLAIENVAKRKLMCR